MGLWLLQESLRTWDARGLGGRRWTTLLAAAAALPPGGPVIDPDDPAFLPPGDMPARIAAACRDAGAAGAGEPGRTSSAASWTAWPWPTAARSPTRSGCPAAVDVVHIVGGGARNELLCQLTADACGLPVVAGPVEATALGNVLVQARALGAVGGDLAALRALVRAATHLDRYEPRT